jgi:hypothetical protein
MPNAMVVATVVNTSMNEAAFRQHVVEQLRSNNGSLLNQLADADGDANVVTAVLSVDKFLAYLIGRFPKAVDAAISSGNLADGAALAEQLERSVVTDGMNEIEFMDYMLNRIEAGEIEPFARLSEEELQAMEDERIGEDFSRYPFLY